MSFTAKSAAGSASIARRLLELGDARATGVLSLARGQVQKQLYLRDGLLVGAESNLREEALGEILVALGLIGQSRLPTLLSETRRLGQKMGAVLVDLGWANADAVLSALAEQVRRRAQGCLRWDASESSFEPTSAFVGGRIEHPWELPPVVFAGLRASASFELLLPVLDAGTARYLVPAPELERHRAAFAGVFGELLLGLVAANTAVHDLVLHPEAPVLLEAIDALLVTGLGHLEEAGRALPIAATPAAPVITDFDVNPGSFRTPQGPTRVDPLGAELAFREGSDEMAAGRLAEALPHLRRAVGLRPDQAAYHAALGWLLFQLEGEAALPEALDRVEHAVAVDPDSPDAHALCADVLLGIGDGARARTHFERTLVLKPEQPDVIDRLAGLYVGAGQFADAERFYRWILVALGERAPALRQRLWRELAELLAGPLANPAEAARATAMIGRIQGGGRG